MKANSPADYKGWQSPYQTLPNGTGLHLNASAGSESAPTVNVQGTGAVWSAIAFKSTAGSFSPPVAGPISLVQFADPDPASGLTGLNCTPSCSLPVLSTGAGHLLYLESADIAGTFISSVSGGGTWVAPAGCRINGGHAAGEAISCAYVLSSTAGTTSISITMTGSASAQFAFFEVATSVGAFTFDTIGTATNAASRNPSGVTLNLAAGGNDIVFGSISVFGGTSSLSYYPLIRGCRSGCGPQFYNGQAASDAILNVPGGTTAPVPQWANQQNNSTVVSGIAFKASLATINAATCNAPDVTTALNSVASDGTTVVLPTCSGIQWGGTGPSVNYNQVFSTILQGQSTVATTDANGRPLTFNDLTAICDLVSNASNETFRITTAANKTFRMTGISFVANCGQTTSRNTGVISVRGNSHSFRADHNHFNGAQGPRFLNIASGNVFGVADHNLFDEANSVNINYLEVNGANYNASGDSFGDASWTDVANFGSGNFFFAEDNTMTATISTGAHCFDIQQGGRMVFRRNTCHNSPFQAHAIGHDGPTFRDRGPRSFEVYQNTLDWPNGGAPFAFAMDYEGGTSLWWGNILTAGAFNQFINQDYRRATGVTYVQNQPPNGWGYCGTQQTGPNGPGPSVWDQNIDASGRGCLDGIGRGKGDSITGTIWPNVNNAVTGTQTWTRQSLEPMYVWANTTPSLSNCYVCSNQTETDAVNNRDYYLELPNTNNPATFNGTAGIGNGTLTPSTAGSYTNAPSCTNGVAYWQSNTQILFQCQAAWGAMDEWFPFSAAGTAGSTVTPTNLAAGAVGPSTSWTLNPATPALAFNVTQADMGGSVIIAGVIYTFGTFSQAVALNDANNFTYANATGSWSGRRQMTVNGFVTPGFLNAGASGQNIDLIFIQDNATGTSPSTGFAVLQMNNGQPCYCARVETNGGSPAGTIIRSANITLIPGHRYSYSFLWDEVNALAQLSIFDPSNSFAQIGATVSIGQIPGAGGIGTFRFGNAETGTSAGNFTYFENMMFDWTNHVFPNKPTTSWAQFYQPFTYPHPLIGGGSPSVSISPFTTNFGNQLQNTTGASQTVTVTNSGTAALVLSTPYFSITGGNAADFTNTGTGTCTNGATINTGANCTVVLTFRPANLGPESATLNINGNATGSSTLSGTGISGSQAGNCTENLNVNPVVAASHAAKACKP